MSHFRTHSPLLSDSAAALVGSSGANVFVGRFFFVLMMYVLIITYINVQINFKHQLDNIDLTELWVPINSTQYF